MANSKLSSLDDSKLDDLVVNKRRPSRRLSTLAATAAPTSGSVLGLDRVDRFDYSSLCPDPPSPPGPWLSHCHGKGIWFGDLMLIPDPRPTARKSSYGRAQRMSLQRPRPRSPSPPRVRRRTTISLEGIVAIIPASELVDLDDSFR